MVNLFYHIFVFKGIAFLNIKIVETDLKKIILKLFLLIENQHLEEKKNNYMNYKISG